MRGQIAERVAARDAAAVAQACAALGGRGSMVFGMVVSDFPGRIEVRQEALASLEKMISTLDHDQCERLFDIVSASDLPVDVSKRRERWDADRRVHADRVDRELEQRVASASAEELVIGCAWLGRPTGKAFGLELGPLAPERRQAHADVGIARLGALIKAMPDGECRKVLKLVRTSRLAIDVSARTAELAARHGAVFTSELEGVEDEPMNPELERAIDERPDDEHAWSVLADWLTEQGHPRGELIALQLRSETDPALASAIEEHMTAHGKPLLGPLVAHQVTHDHHEAPAFTWRRGFIERALVSIVEGSDEDCDRTTAELVTLVCAHPSGRRLAALAIGLNGEISESPLDPVIEAIASGAPASLRELHLGVFEQDDCEISWYEIGDVAPLWRGVPGLRRLILHGGNMDLGVIDHAQLERLEIQTGGLAAGNARAIATAKLPRLRHLDVWYGDPNYGGDALIGDVRPLLERTDLPMLEHLGLMNCAFTDAICEILAAQPLAAQLRELDLSMGTMGPAGAQALAAGAKSLAKLESIDVSDNYLDADSLALLRGAFPHVVSRDQRDGEAGDEADRYPAVGE